MKELLEISLIGMASAGSLLIVIVVFGSAFSTRRKKTNRKLKKYNRYENKTHTG